MITLFPELKIVKTLGHDRQGVLESLTPTTESRDGQLQPFRRTDIVAGLSAAIQHVRERRQQFRLGIVVLSEKPFGTLQQAAKDSIDGLLASGAVVNVIRNAEGKNDVQASICIAVLNAHGKLVMESVVATSAATSIAFLNGLCGQIEVSFEEDPHAPWRYVLKTTKATVIVCNPRKHRLLSDGNKSDQVDARKLAQLLPAGLLSPVYHGQHGVRDLKELVRSKEKKGLRKKLGEPMNPEVSPLEATALMLVMLTQKALNDDFQRTPKEFAVRSSRKPSWLEADRGGPTLALNDPRNIEKSRTVFNAAARGVTHLSVAEAISLADDTLDKLGIKK